MATFFITLRPQHPSLHHHVCQYVRPIKRATHPLAVAANLHLKNSTNQHDPHIHLTVDTDDVDTLRTRLNYFMPTWRITYWQPARNVRATLYYAASKEDADPIFYRGDLGEQC